MRLRKYSLLGKKEARRKEERKRRLTHLIQQELRKLLVNGGLSSSLIKQESLLLDAQVSLKRGRKQSSGSSSIKPFTSHSLTTLRGG